MYYSSRESPFVHTPDNSSLDLSEVNVVFEPSDELQATLAQFVQPDLRPRFKPRLKSDTVARLPVIGGDANGLKHWHTSGESKNIQSDTEWLRDYDKAVRSLGNHAIPLANAYPKVETLQDGSLAIELPLAADKQTIAKIGKKALREVRFMIGESEARKEVIKGHLVIPRSRLVDHSAQADAVEMLLEKLHAEVNSTYEPSPPDSRMYVSQPFVTDKLIH